MNSSMFLEKLKERTRPQLSSTYFSLMVAGFFVVFYNASFFEAVKSTLDYTSSRDFIFIVSISLLLLALTFIIVSMLVLPYLVKPLISIIFIAAACVTYFMDAYGIVMHRLMIQNMVETDLLEIKGLLNIRLFLYVLSLLASS